MFAQLLNQINVMHDGQKLPLMVNGILKEVNKWVM